MKPALAVSSAPTQDPTAHTEPLGVPFSRFLAVIRRRAWLIVLMLLAGTGGVATYLSRVPPSYTAQSSILVEPRRTQVSDLQALSPDADGLNLMRTQIDILRSPSLARRVAEQLGLLEHPEFQSSPGLISTLKARLSQLVFRNNEPGRTPTREERFDATVAALVDAIGLQNEARSNVLYITAVTRSPELSAAVANEFARQYLEFRRKQKYAVIERAHIWFSDRLAELAEKTRASERAVEEFRAVRGLAEVATTRTGIPNAQTVNRQQLDEVARQLVTVSGERARKEAQLAQAQSALQGQRGPDALPEVLNSLIVQRLRSEEAIVAGREAEIASTQGDRGPDLMAVRAQRRGLQRRIQEETANATAGLANEVSAARAQETALRAQLEKLRSAVTTDNAAEVQLQGLIAEAQASRQIYESFLVRATQLTNVAGIQEPDAELVSTATPPTVPSGPKRGRLLGLAAGASLVLGVVLACMLERLGKGFATPEAIEAELGLSTIGLVPRASQRLRRGLPTRRGGLDFAAALSRIRGMIRFYDPGHPPRVVLITSAIPREGKSVFAAALGRNAAQAGLKALLLDCDMRNPTAAAECGLAAKSGLAEILAGDVLGDDRVTMQQAAVGLDVLPAGNAKHDPQVLLASPRMEEILRTVRARYDLVIIDAPPILSVTDALILARIADATVLAVRWEKTPRAAVRDATRLLLQASGNRLLGCVLTQVHLMRFARMSTGGFAYAYRGYRDYGRPLLPSHGRGLRH